MPNSILPQDQDGQDIFNAIYSFFFLSCCLVRLLPVSVTDRIMGYIDKTEKKLIRFNIFQIFEASGMIVGTHAS